MRVTHRFHPLFGRDFEFVAHRHNWGEDRVHDPFVVIAGGRCPFTAGGLLALADLIGRLRSRPGSGEAVRQITP